MKKIFKNIVSKSNIKPVLQKIRVTVSDLVATDSYKLLKVKADALASDDALKHSVIVSRLAGKPYALVTPEDVGYKLDMMPNIPIDTEDDFPEFERIMPEAKDLEDSDQYATIKLDAGHLAQLMQAIDDTFGKKVFHHVAIRVPVGIHLHCKPLVIERLDKKAIGVLMPVND